MQVTPALPVPSQAQVSGSAPTVGPDQSVRRLQAPLHVAKFAALEQGDRIESRLDAMRKAIGTMALPDEVELRRLAALPQDAGGRPPAPTRHAGATPEARERV